MNETNTIRIWTSEFSPKPARPNALPLPGSLPDQARKVVAVSTEKLVENLRDALKSFQDLPDEISPGFSIGEIELNFAVDATGGIELIGKLQTTVTASISVKMVRNKKS